MDDLRERVAQLVCTATASDDGYEFSAATRGALGALQHMEQALRDASTALGNAAVSRADMLKACGADA